MFSTRKLREQDALLQESAQRRAEIERLYAEKFDAYEVVTQALLQITQQSIHNVHRVHEARQLLETMPLHEIEPVIAQIRAAYPASQVELMIIDDEYMHRMLPGTQNDEFPWSIPQEDSYCRYAVVTDEPLAVEDAAHHPIVCRSPFSAEVRSYIGAPIHVNDYAVGTLCAFGGPPRTEPWSRSEIDRMVAWADEISRICQERVCS